MCELSQNCLEPERELCRWNEHINIRPSIFELEAIFEPSVACPVVFHLFGCNSIEDVELPESLVLTEDDYLKFLFNISKDQELFPARIQKAFTKSSLLFLGYQFSDLDFRIVFRALANYLEKSLRSPHISVQLTPPETTYAKHQVEKIQDYLNNYFNKLQIHVYWGTCHDFTTELRERWKAFERDR